MITLLDTMGPAVWRASWQAALLAILVALALWTLGERVTPRWRYLLWSVVVVRLLFVVTPGSPWSVFNLVRFESDAAAETVVAEDVQQSKVMRAPPAILLLPILPSPVPSPSPRAWAGTPQDPRCRSA